MATTVQNSVALENYLKETKLELASIVLANPGDVFTEGEGMEQTENEGSLTFEQWLQLQEQELMMLELRRKMQMKERGPKGRLKDSMKDRERIRKKKDYSEKRND